MLAALNRPSGDDDSVFRNRIKTERKKVKGDEENKFYNHLTDWNNFNVTFYLWIVNIH